MKRLKDSCVSNPFDYVFFRHSRAHLSHEDVETLEAALKDAAERFKTKVPRAVRSLSDRYINIHGNIPGWAWKFFESLADRLADQDLRNYLVALTTRENEEDKKKKKKAKEKAEKRKLDMLAGLMVLGQLMKEN
jgi:hypothetical protein